MKKISVVIPTFQRDVETLNNLVSTLVNDANNTNNYTNIKG